MPAIDSNNPNPREGIKTSYVNVSTDLYLKNNSNNPNPREGIKTQQAQPMSQTYHLIRITQILVRGLKHKNRPCHNDKAYYIRITQILVRGLKLKSSRHASKRRFKCIRITQILVRGLKPPNEVFDQMQGYVDSNNPNPREGIKTFTLIFQLLRCW